MSKTEDRAALIAETRAKVIAEIREAADIEHDQFGEHGEVELAGYWTIGTRELAAIEGDAGVDLVILTIAEWEAAEQEKAAALAVIEQVQAYRNEAFAHLDNAAHEVLLEDVIDALDAILAAVPTDVPTKRDAEKKAEALEEAAKIADGVASNWAMTYRQFAATEIAAAIRKEAGL